MLKKQHYAKKLAGLRLAVKYYIDGMKPDLELARRQLEEASLDAVRLAGGCDDARWRWTPARGVWSAAECIAHLNKTNQEYASAIRRLIERSNVELSTST